MTHSIRVASLLASIVACILLASSTANHLRVEEKTTSNNQLVTSESEETQVVICAAVGIATWLWKIGKAGAAVSAENSNHAKLVKQQKELLKGLTTDSHFVMINIEAINEKFEGKTIGKPCRSRHYKKYGTYQFCVSKAEDLSVDTKIIAKFKRNGKNYYIGKISTLNTDGTYDITFDDGDERKNTPLNEMQCN